MKFIKVTALAAAMMTTFGAQAELTAMDDAALEAVSGQRGIEITLTNGGADNNILSTDFAYDDQDGDTGAASAGSLFLENTEIFGTNAGGTMTATIDVRGTGGNEAIVIDLDGLGVRNTTIGIGAITATNGLAFGDAGIVAIGRTAMTFNGTVAIAVEAQ